MLRRQETLYPLEFFVAATPISLQASARSKQRWKHAIQHHARERVRSTDEIGFLDDRALSLTIYYFAAARMEGTSTTS